MEKHDVVIVGAGFGGLKAAEKLAIRDKDVLVLDKQPEDRIGDRPHLGIIAPNAMNFVSPSLYQKMYAPKIYMMEHLLDVAGMLDIKVAVVDPLEMGQWQVKEAKKRGAEIRGESYVKKVVKKQNKVVLKNGEEIEYNYLIASDGSTSVVAKSLGLEMFNKMFLYYYIVDERLKDFELIMDSSENEGWYWTCIVPHGKQTYIGSGYGNRAVKCSERGRVLKKFMFKHRGIDLEGGRFRAAPINWSYNGFKHRNIFFVGNAASFQNPTFFLGVSSAFKSGEAAAKAILGEDYKSDLKEALRFHKSGGQLYTLMAKTGLFGGGANFNLDKMNTSLDRYAKVFMKFGDSRFGTFALGGINRHLGKLLKSHPTISLPLYLTLIMSPASFNSFESIKEIVDFAFC